VTRRRPDHMRWKLELPGTSAHHVHALEAAIDEVGWTRHPTELLYGMGVTRIYLTTDRGESAEHITVELLERMAYNLPNVAGTKPTTWAEAWPEIAARVQRAQESRAVHGRPRRASQRPTQRQPLPGFG
jgi:hypothetical protein